MISKREKAKSTKFQTKEKLANQRKEKLADFLIDVAKYVLTGVIITSIFKDVTNKSSLYLEGTAFVILTLIVGLIITNKRKE